MIDIGLAFFHALIFGLLTVEGAWRATRHITTSGRPKHAAWATAMLGIALLNAALAVRHILNAP